MTEQQCKQVFDPFIQADLSTTKHYGGTGLGLTISLRYCQLMGGDIRVESELERGSSFTLRLPSHPLTLHTCPMIATCRHSSAIEHTRGAHLFVEQGWRR